MSNNLSLWNKVCVTDKRHTKEVNFGRKITAIDAMHQVKLATEQFGAAGEGWGWHFSDPIFTPNNTIVIKCTLWHGSKENTIEQYGQKCLNIVNRKTGKDTVDEDAFKKAATDGLTKCLSYLGFNADVFMGLFDDNKYVEYATQVIKAKQIKQMSGDILNRLDSIQSLSDLEAMKTDMSNEFSVIKTNKTIYDEVIERCKSKKEQLTKNEE